MNCRKVILLAVVVLTGAACTTTGQFAATGFEPPSGNYKLIVMQPDISVGLLTMGGMVEPRVDWTEQARDNILQALVSQQASRGGNAKVAMKLEDAGGDPDTVRDLASLHNAVGQSILLHKYLNVALPTKKDVFDWTLGATAVEYGADTDFDYALFLHAESSFSSGSRTALQVAGLLSCAFGVCVGFSGGQDVAFASLVDLSTGRVTWFNVLVSGVGDIRTPDGADAMVTRLLASMQEGKVSKSDTDR